MAINISFQPSAAAIGGAGLMAGNADFQRWRAQQLQQAYQFAVSSALQAQQQNFSRQQAFSQLAGQQQSQQSQQAFELQKLPLQAQIESQQQAYQSYLQGQNQQNLALLQGNIADQASSRDFAEQQDILAQQGEQHAAQAQAQQLMQQEGQRQLAQYQNQLQDGGNQFQQTFQNPFQQHQKNLQLAQQQGMQLSPDQQQQAEGIKSDIGAMQDAVASGRNTLSTIKPAFEAAVGKLNAISQNPAGEIPPPKPEQFQKDMLWVDQQSGQIDNKPGPGKTPFQQIRQKDGSTSWEVPRGFRAGESGEPSGVDEQGNPVFQSEKARGQWLKNQEAEGKVELQAYHEARKALAEEKKNPMFGFQQTPMGIVGIPGYEQQRLSQLEQEFSARLARRPSGAGAVPAGTPHPDGGAQQQGGSMAPPPPAGIPAPGGQPRQDMHFDPQRGPVAGPAQTQHFDPQRGPVAGPAQGAQPGSFQQNPPQETTQQIQQRAAQHYVEISHQLPPEWKQAEQEYAKAGNHGGAVAVAGMWGIQQQYGPDPSRWPPNVVQAAIDFRRQAPHVPVI